MATDNITDKNTLKSWFRRGLKPLESQFAAWIDSYWHKSENIPTGSIAGLESVLNSKAESAALGELSDDLARHKEDGTRHKTPSEQGKLDHLADRPDTTYVTKDELDELKNNPDVIIIPVDFTKPEAERVAEIKAFVLPLVTDGTFLTRPLFAKYIWRDLYDGSADDYLYSDIVFSEPMPNSTGYYFSSPKEVTSVDALDDYGKIRTTISVNYTRDPITISARFTEVEPTSDRTFFLYDNGDGMISPGDAEKDMPTVNWSKFFSSLKEGLTPTVYLKTPNTDIYIVASYKIVEDAITHKWLGYIEIQYVKVVDGVHQLWIERRVFTQELGGFFGIGSQYETNKDNGYDPVVARINFKENVNLSATIDDFSLAVRNDCGDGFSVPAATSTTAGVMTSSDRLKMVELFNGSMLDSVNPIGFHRHNYLEMADLPPTIELSASTYQEFKDAVNKLQGISSLNKKFGKILLIGKCTIDDDTEFNLTNIDIDCFSGGFCVVNKPLKICGSVKLTHLSLDSSLNVYDKGFEALRVRINIWERVEINTLYINRCPYPDATPQITVSGNSTNGNVYFTVNKLLGYSGSGQGHHPCIIKCNNTGTTVVKIGEIERMGIDNDFDSVRIVSSNLSHVCLTVSKNVLIENIAEISDLRLISGGLFDIRSCESSVPVPSVGVRTKYHILNALGEWVDIRTLIGAQ